MIYLELDKQPETIEELLTELFSYDDDGTLKNVCTYEDPECNSLECDECKYRSIDAVIEIVKTYFPNATDEDAIQNLFKLTLENDEGEFCKARLINCYDICMPTVCFTDGDYIAINDTLKSDKLFNSRFNDWADVASRIGINTESELISYR